MKTTKFIALMAIISVMISGLSAGTAEYRPSNEVLRTLACKATQ